MGLKIALSGEFKYPGGLPPLLMGILKTVMEAEGLPENAEVSLFFCSDATIRDLNRRYRKADKATDVLSFPQYRCREELLAEGDDTLLLGDIVISLERAREQAVTYGHSLKRELGFLFTHGLLHLLGYDHEEPQGSREMRQKEENILELAGLRREDDASPQL